MSAAGFFGGPWGMAASMLAPSILGHLFQPGDNTRKLRAQAMAQFDPRNLSNDQDALFRNMMNGAGMNQARSEILGSAQAGMGGIQRHLAQTGLGRSGVGVAALGAAHAAPGLNIGRLTADAWGQAAQQAQGLAQSRANAIMGGGFQQGMGAPMLGAGMSAFLPFLFKLMQQKAQGGQGGGGVNGQNFYGGNPEWNPNEPWMDGR